MSQQPTDTPTRRYDLMQMRIEQIQGLVTILQQRRTATEDTVKRIKRNAKIATARTNDAELSKIMDKLEKQIAKLTKDHDAITALLDRSRALIFELSDGEVIVEKSNGNAKG